MSVTDLVSETCTGVERPVCILIWVYHARRPVPCDHRRKPSQPALTQRLKIPSYITWIGRVWPGRLGGC